MNNVQPEKFIRAAIFSASGKTSAGTRSKGGMPAFIVSAVSQDGIRERP